MKWCFPFPPKNCGEWGQGGCGAEGDWESCRISIGTLRTQDISTEWHGDLEIMEDSKKISYFPLKDDKREAF